MRGETRSTGALERFKKGGVGEFRDEVQIYRHDRRVPDRDHVPFVRVDVLFQPRYLYYSS